MKSIRDDIETPLYLARVTTFQIAKDLAGRESNVSTVDEAFTQAPPFCLRILRPYRTPETQAFRNRVARETRARRAKS